MTQSTTSATPAVKSDRGQSAPSRSSRPQAGQMVTVIVLVVSLIGAGVMREVATRFQQTHSPFARRTSGASTSLAGMDSYAMALLLGGLRGPLVMVLWANSEAQKADRDLEGIDTQIDWIRRLQPEFDSVHVFQMWNKAYNLSVQMVGLSNKYTTILDAIDYGKNVDAERPDNLNILKEMARIYGDKLANSNPEKYYYRDRIRRETRYREQVGAQRGEPGFQRTLHDSMLDPEGRILSQFVKPRQGFERRKGEDMYDGSELQFLKQFEPYRYGLSPSAIGFNYNKRAQSLLATDEQKPLGLSAAVIDSQPAVSLKMWAENEWEHSRRLEAKAFGVALPVERVNQEAPTASLAITSTPTDPVAFAELLDTYELIVRVAQQSIAEYERHLRNPDYITNRGKYASHIDIVQAMHSLITGDLSYLRAMQASGEQRSALLATAAQSYRRTIREHVLLTVRYYTSDKLASMVLPPGVTRANVGTGGPGSMTAVTDEDVMRMMNGINAAIQQTPQLDENAEDRAEYMSYINRAQERLNQIKAATAG